MRNRKQQSGFAVVELVLVVVILAAIGFVGWWVYQKHNTADTTSAVSAQSPVAKNVSTAPTINSTSDLDAALNALNRNDPSTANGSDANQLDSQSDF
jgi:predicted negative regulator of RcsB-dependent stress response